MTSKYNNENAREMFELVKKFNRGLRSVTNEGKDFVFYCGSGKCATGVVVDMLRSKAFASVTTQANQELQCYVVTAKAN